MLLLTGVVVGLIGWINQAYLKEQVNWFVTVRPYMLASVRPYVLAPDAERALKPLASFRECARECPEMIVVPPGTFRMGSPATEKNRRADEGPQHQVAIAAPFAVSKFPVTFADWDVCVATGGCPPTGDHGMGRGNKPVVNVNWDEAQQYVAWFSRMTGRPYRLLTEAEWEYAARPGTTTPYYWGEEIGRGNANCNGCGSEFDNRQTSPVGSFKPNAFGLYDMLGNVWQWVEDCYRDSYNAAPDDGSAVGEGQCRVLRGGGYISAPQKVRSARRITNPQDNRDHMVGFRIGRTLGP